MMTYLLQIIIGISFLVSLLSFYFKYPVYLKWFSIYLFCTLIVELAGRYIRVHNGNNHLLYTIYTTLEFLFFSLFYQRATENEQIKTVVRWFIFFYPPIVVVNVLFIQGPAHFHTYTYSIGCIFMIFLCLNYFRNLMLKATNSYIPLFWITAALLLFFSIDIVFTTTINTLVYKNRALAQSFSLVIRYLNYIMYFLFIIAYLCPLMKRK